MSDPLGDTQSWVASHALQNHCHPWQDKGHAAISKAVTEMALHGQSATEPHSPLLGTKFALKRKFLFIGHLSTGIGKILVSNK